MTLALKVPSSWAYILILGSPEFPPLITSHSPNRSRISLASVSYGKFVAYTAVFPDLGGLEMSVDLKLWLSLVEVVAEDGSYFSSSMRRESTNANIRVRFRGVHGGTR